MSVINSFVDIAIDRGVEWPPLYLAPVLFSTTLSRKIRDGIKPEEIMVEEESRLWRRDLCS